MNQSHYFIYRPRKCDVFKGKMENHISVYCGTSAVDGLPQQHLSAVCEQYEYLSNEKSGQLFVESLKSDFKRGTNFLTRLATLHCGRVPASVGAGRPGTGY